jgi:hypothetical protein
MGEAADTVRLCEGSESRLTARTGLADYQDYNDLYDLFIATASKFHSADLIPLERVAANGVDVEFTIPAFCGRDDQDMSKREVTQRDYYLTQWKALDALLDAIASSTYVFRRLHHMLRPVHTRKRCLDTDEADQEYIRSHYKARLLTIVHRDHENNGEEKIYPC